MQVLSRYEVRREIGRGGMGVVYEAFDTKLRRPVALKVLSDAAVDPGRRSRFEQEARAASALNHPNIVTVHDIDSAGDDRYIVMEYVEGEPLSARIASGPLAVDAALAYAEQIASALAAAHAAGIVHRDLKPANVMVAPGGRVKVVDFGLSKLLLQTAPDESTATHLGPVTEPGVVSGTAGYMSPEQASGDPVDARTDVFAFGTVLYEMLAGRPAFRGDSFWSTVRAVMQQQPQPVARVRSDVPAAAQRVIDRCLAKDPAGRYPSGIELHAAVSALTGRRSRGVSRRLLRTAALIVGIAVAAPAIPAYRWYSARVKASALEEIDRSLDGGQYAAAYVRARELGMSRRPDPEVQRALSRVSYAAEVKTEPAGATISFRQYGDPDAPWHVLGVPPVARIRPPVGALHWKIEKDGYAPVEGRFWWGLHRPIKLHRASDAPRFYSFEPSPLDVRPEALAETEDWTQERVSIAAAYGQERIPIQILKPRNAAPPYQAVIWFPGTYSLQLGENDRMTMSYYFDFVAKSGRAIVMPDFQGMYARRQAQPGRALEPQTDAYRERVIQSSKDLNRTFDYLETRADIDRKRVVFYVLSAGGATLPVPAMEPRLAGLILLSAGLPRRVFPPEIEPANFAPRITIPVLLLGGRYDYLSPVESSQKPLFDLLGTPAPNKRHVIFESGHVPARIAVIREVLGWLDQRLGIPNPIQSRLADPHHESQINPESSLRFGIRLDSPLRDS